MVIFYHRLPKINLYTDLPYSKRTDLLAKKFSCFQDDNFEKPQKRLLKKFNNM
jgi:hypothetical protein